MILDDEDRQAIESLESSLGVPAGFYANLRRDDDWSFVIKLHALLEASIAFLLANVISKAYNELAPPDLHRGDLRELFSWLDMSNPRTGKVSFLKALGLLDKPHRRFIVTLSELRNVLAHDVRNVGSTILDYSSGLDEKRRSSWLESISYGVRPTTSHGLPAEKFALINPRESLWISGLHCLQQVAWCSKFFHLSASAFG